MTSPAQEQGLSEEAWWNRYGDLQDQIWQYDERLTRLVRSEYLADMEEFLFQPGGHLLDFGCGTGWVGLRIARKGMSLLGVDLSDVQVAQARRNAAEAGVSRTEFRQGGVEEITSQSRYDGVILHALLHHLSESEMKTLMSRLADALCPGGRIYAYEPVAPSPNPPIGAWLLDKASLLWVRMLRALAFHLRLQSQNVRRAIQAGWSMKSPNERPVKLGHLEALLPDELVVADITYWHMCAVAHANICMGLRSPWRELLSGLTPLSKSIDKIVLATPWRVHLQGWPMVGVKMMKCEMQCRSHVTGDA